MPDHTRPVFQKKTRTRTEDKPNKQTNSPSGKRTHLLALGDELIVCLGGRLGCLSAGPLGGGPGALALFLHK